MRTVLYFEWTRKKKSLLKQVIWPIGVVLVLFVICTIADVVFPRFNAAYMKWPELLKDLFCLKSWTSHLWLNVWQFFALGYPFYLIYRIMDGLTKALAEEDRLETVVYLHNAGVTRRALFLGKGLVWGAEAFACCISLLVVTVLSALVLGASQTALHMLGHYVGLWLISLLYIAVALFMVAGKGAEGVFSERISAVLVLPWLVSALPALFRFFSSLLEMTGREGAPADVMAALGERMKMLTVLSPVTWCFPAFQLSAAYVVCGVVIFVVLFAAGLSIYTHKR